MMLQARGYDAHNVRGRHGGLGRGGVPFTAEDGSDGRVA